MSDREKVERELRQKYGFSIENLNDEHVCSDVARLPDGDWRHILPSDARVLWQALVDQGMEEQRWIPVSERLPVTGQFVEVFTKSGNFHGPATLGTNADDETRWALKNGSWIKPEYVSHWRLPAPPREGER